MRMVPITSTTGKVMDKQAITDIFEQHSPGIFRYASRMLNDSELAEDCVSETFNRFLITIRGGNQPEMVKAYLYRTAHNWVIDHYRRKPIPDVSLDDSLHADPDSNPARQVSIIMESQRIRAALMHLPSDQRQVIELRFLEEWPHDDVAELMGKTIEATRALQHRAVNALRKLLSD